MTIKMSQSDHKSRERANAKHLLNYFFVGLMSQFVSGKSKITLKNFKLKCPKVITRAARVGVQNRVVFRRNKRPYFITITIDFSEKSFSMPRVYTITVIFL